MYFSCIYFQKLYSHGAWLDVKDLERHSRLSCTAKKIPDIVRASKSKNTVKKYDGYFLKFANWCKENNLQYLPAKESTVCAFLTELVTNKRSSSVIDSFYFSIKWHHSVASCSANPCDSAISKMTYEGCKRISGQAVQQKQPITVDILKKIVDKYSDPDVNDLKNLRLCVMCVLGFSGFFRYSELSSIRMNDITFNIDHVCIKVRSSKTDQLQSGTDVVIAKTGTKLCPVSWLQKYIHVAGLAASSDDFLFSKLRFMKKTGKFVLANPQVSLSYTRAREILLDALSSVGENSRNFGLHSLRSGGASAFANSDTVVDRCLLNKHGRWKSSASSDRYIHYNKNNKLKASLNLGI